MSADIVSTKYFGQLDLDELPIMEDELYTIPLGGRDTQIPVNWAIIAPEAFSEPERQNFLTCMDTIPRMYALVKQHIRQEFSNRTLFRHRIKDQALRNFVEAAGNAVSGLRIESCEALLEILTLDAVDFGQGPCGEFCCELYFRCGSEESPSLTAEFQGPDRVSRLYFRSK